jgi:hypothetical protein
MRSDDTLILRRVNFHPSQVEAVLSTDRGPCPEDRGA